MADGVGVAVGVNVPVGVLVGVGDFVGVGEFVGTGELVGVGEFVGTGVLVGVGVGLDTHGAQFCVVVLHPSVQLLVPPHCALQAPQVVAPGTHCCCSLALGSGAS